MIAWPQGVVMTPYTGDTFAVVEAKGATGAKVGGYSGVRIESMGTRRRALSEPVRDE